MKLLKKSSLFLLFVYILTFNIIKINALDTKKNSPSASPITNIQINSDVPRGTLTTQHNLSVSTTCDSSFLYNIDTGIVYSNKNDNAILPVASISKTFTLYLIFDKLSKNELKLDEKIGLSSKAAYIEKMLGNTSTNLDPNKKYTVDELLKLSIVPSSNGAIIALNEYLFGSEEKALEKVKQLFDKMSIKRYSLVNVSGLTNKDYMNFKNKSFPDQSGNSISSRDYAKFLHNFIERFPKYFDYSKIVSFEYDSIEGKKKAVTTNYLLPGQSQHFKGTIGFKTGHTPFAKYNNAVVIDREKGGRIGAFAFGCNTLGERYSEVKKLAKAYYENPNLRLLLAKNFKVSSNIEIYGSLVRSTNTYIKNDF